MPYVFSTLACDQKYVNYEPVPDTNRDSRSQAMDLPKPIRSVLIKGGSQVINKSLVTPMGVMTTVSDEELEALEQNEVFKMHRRDGFISIEKNKADPEKIIEKRNLNLLDGSRQLVPDDKRFKPDGPALM